MSDFRIRYGLAYGPYGTAGPTSANHLITPGDTTPNVSLGAFFVTANTSATTITYFDVVGAGGIDPTANNGKVITLLFQDNLTTIANANQIFLAGTQGAFTSGQTVSFISYNSAWYQYPNSDVVGRETVKTMTLATTDSAPNISGAEVVILTPSGGAMTVSALSGGRIGQQVWVGKNAVSAGTAITLLGTTQFVLAGTTAIVMNGTAFYAFINDNGTRFRSQSSLVSP